ncbi:hypothetical protein [Marinicrinis lubricantis]|uniref:PH domain-containing protein n=1 Tax=Marinicrinis lubricantis TaxID=2086470 RepID=A0ABW1IL12_9BACL
MNSKKELYEWKNALTKVQKEFARKNKELKSQSKKLRKQSKEMEITPWVSEVRQLYGQDNYSFIKLIRLLRKRDIL